MNTLSDTDPEALRVQIELLRAAGPQRRSHIAFTMSQAMIDQSRRAIREVNPDLSELELKLLFVKLNYGDQLAAEVRAAMGHVIEFRNRTD